MAASSGPDSKDLRRKFGQSKLRRGTDFSGAGAKRGEGQPFRRVTRYEEQMTMAQVKSIVFRYIMIYYNRQRIYTSNPGGLPPAMYRQAARGLAA